ncbi:unnamed protein product [Adineta ricciae]|uniref:BZIP domain-containing protein n=1 Tax=Adineta ricciae TaxID=249248 RepID=A0A814BE74_ADIRI|nr:unnamed protein product [Adineta ricciae]CAF0926680.1 unnamed protein product [Adineta ricciae]
MENTTLTHIETLSSTTPNSFILSPILNTTATTPTLHILQPASRVQSAIIDPDKNKTHTNKESKLLVKQEQSDYTSRPEEQLLARRIPISNQLRKTLVTPLQLDPRESLNSPSTVSMSMANIGGHLMSALNPTHLPENTGGYHFSNLPNDLASSYKHSRSSNPDLSSPSNSSNSSNPSSSHHHQSKRQDEGGDPTRKRAVRLQKNRDAARECRRKKKEYIKCLEERVTGLETQNKALIEELRQLKELYCQREESNTNKTTTSSR